MFGWFKKLGSWLGKAVGFVETKVSDANIALAVQWVKVARDTIVDNDKRRAFVIGMLMKQSGMSESMARLLVELAVSLVKSGA